MIGNGKEARVNGDGNTVKVHALGPANIGSQQLYFICLDETQVFPGLFFTITISRAYVVHLQYFCKYYFNYHSEGALEPELYTFLIT